MRRDLRKNSNKIDIRGLTKTSMDMEIIKKSYEQISSKGRDILKQLEEFKFTLEQSERLFQNNQQLLKNIDNKRNSIDEVSNKIYQLVFDIENTDISKTFEQLLEPDQGVQQDVPNNSPAGEKPQPPVPGPGQPGSVPPNPNISDKSEDNGVSGPSSGPPSGSPANKSNNEDSDSKEDKDSDDKDGESEANEDADTDLENDDL